MAVIVVRRRAAGIPTGRDLNGQQSIIRSGLILVRLSWTYQAGSAQGTLEP
jgi:hypothetical protein